MRSLSPNHSKTRIVYCFEEFSGIYLTFYNLRSYAQILCLFYLQDFLFGHNIFRTKFFHSIFLLKFLNPTLDLKLDNFFGPKKYLDIDIYFGPSIFLPKIFSGLPNLVWAKNQTQRRIWVWHSKLSLLTLLGGWG